MIVGNDLNRKARQVIVPVVGATLVLYFAYHAVQGDRGLIAWWNLRYEIERTETTLAKVEAERETLEHRVALLRPDSLDRDMLEEQSRLMLGAVHGDDLIVPNPTHK